MYLVATTTLHCRRNPIRLGDRSDILMFRLNMLMERYTLFTLHPGKQQQSFGFFLISGDYEAFKV